MTMDLPWDKAVVIQPRLRSTASETEIEQLLSHAYKEFEHWTRRGITRGMVERSYCLNSTWPSMRLQVGFLAFSPFHNGGFILFCSQKALAFAKATHCIQPILKVGNI